LNFSRVLAILELLEVGRFPGPVILNEPLPTGEEVGLSAADLLLIPRRQR
jgi:hypothetical protein